MFVILFKSNLLKVTAPPHDRWWHLIGVAVSEIVLCLYTPNTLCYTLSFSVHLCCCFVLHTKLWKFQPFFRMLGECLTANKLSFLNNQKSYGRRSSMWLVQNVSQRIPQFHKNISKTSAKLLNATNTGCLWQQLTNLKSVHFGHEHS